ncbi:hypothetical protein L1267_20430 [Pseudoalteromonas sp. OFAV1]|uniref:hypothetical protein n=1 Tax=Pseudoalteromonas sp. OFAV1 TaxID=2908892 RepID=UPI001F21AF10|nr:hypothetical protein [Pseudoalteromonas sp. OFAV1]MCF2902741.1 hypothetical protein [Pseudoalteromonas sp. OFAV1]
MQNTNTNPSSSLTVFIYKSSVVLGALIGIVGGTLGVISYLDSKYPSKKEFNELSISYKKNRLSDTIRATKLRLWDLQDRVGVNPEDISAKENLNELKVDLERYNAEYNALFDKQ